MNPVKIMHFLDEIKKIGEFSYNGLIFIKKTMANKGPNIWHDFNSRSVKPEGFSQARPRVNLYASGVVASISPKQLDPGIWVAALAVCLPLLGFLQRQKSIRNAPRLL